MDSFDYIVVGSGPAGYVSAIRGAQLGMKTALIERYPSLGGTCLNVGCIPSKAMLESSEKYADAQRHFADHGIEVGSLKLDLATMLERKRSVVTQLTDGVGMLMKKNKVTVLTGRGRLQGDGVVEVEGDDGEKTKIKGEHIVLATGSKPVELPFLEFDGDRVIDSTAALELEKVPKSLIVIGAGAVGLEMGSVWARLGAEVTVVEMMGQITPFADKQIAKTLQRALEDQGISIRLETQVKDAEVQKSQVKLTVENKKGETEELKAERVLVAVGRKPYTDDCGLEAAGVELDGKGRIEIDDEFRTSAKGIYAIGDVVRGAMLAHKGEEEGIAVAELVAGHPGHVNYDAIPNVVYTHPELATVGMTEEQAKEQGIELASGKFLYRANGRALGMGESEGMVKILADKETDKLLGAAIVGARASEMIAELTIALEFSASSEDVARTSHAHPTLSEVVKEAALAVSKRQIHG